MEERHVPLSTVAGRLGVSERTVRRWIQAGKLKATRPGRDYRIPESAVKALIEEGEVSPKEQPRLPELVPPGEAYIVPLEEGEEPDTVTLRLYTVRLIDERDRLLQEVRRLEREKAAIREELEKAERARE